MEPGDFGLGFDIIISAQYVESEFEPNTMYGIGNNLKGYNEKALEIGLDN